MENSIIAWSIVLATLVLSALGTVMIRNLLLASVMLALTSACLTVALFIMGVELAAVMELSVCAGLVTAVFVSAISLTKESKGEELVNLKKERLRRFLPLPFIMIVLAAGIALLFSGQDIKIPGGDFSGAASRHVLWDERELDILGIVLIILAGVLGVAVLFKGRQEEE